MRRKPELEIQRLNDEIVGYLLLNRSPPKELVAARDQARAALGYDDRHAEGEGHGRHRPRLPHLWGFTPARPHH